MKKVVPIVGIGLLGFLIGWMLPSPIFKMFAPDNVFEGEEIAVIDTTNMVLSNGDIYEGTLAAKTLTFQGFGILRKENSTYEGNWKNGKLPYGKRTTKLAVYEGRFDDDLNSNGFGIARYSVRYIESKRNQGFKDDQIIAVYVGNWNNNEKSGIGRSVKVDGSMEFGHYKEGLFKKVDGANYRVGNKVYGIDVSHHKKNINWDALALYCDKNGVVYASKPKEKKYMQPVLFAYMKATEGATFKDNTFDIRMIEAERHGIAKGAYHFLRLSSDVDDQVKNFVETANWTSGDMPPALDIEVESEIRNHGIDKFLDVTFRWLEAIETKMKVRPIIYTRENIRDNYLRKDPRFKKYQCWIARYHPDGPVSSEWKIWQLSENGVVSGHDSSIDINLYKDDYASFLAYLRGLEIESSIP